MFRHDIEGDLRHQSVVHSLHTGKTSPINKALNQSVDSPMKKKFGHRIVKLVNNAKEKKKIKKEKKLTEKGIKMTKIPETDQAEESHDDDDSETDNSHSSNN